MAGDESAQNEEILDGLRREPRYRPLDQLGEGSLGRVDRVYDAHLGRVVAAKTLHARHLGETNALRSFVNEARILGRPTGPNATATRGKLSFGFGSGLGLGTARR